MAGRRRCPAPQGCCGGVTDPCRAVEWSFGGYGGVICLPVAGTGGSCLVAPGVSLSVSLFSQTTVNETPGRRGILPLFVCCPPNLIPNVYCGITGRNGENAGFAWVCECNATGLGVFDAFAGCVNGARYNYCQLTLFQQNGNRIGNCAPTEGGDPFGSGFGDTILLRHGQPPNGAGRPIAPGDEFTPLPFVPRSFNGPGTATPYFGPYSCTATAKYLGQFSNGEYPRCPVVA